MKKILIIIFTIAIFVIGGIFGYKKILSIEKENKIIQLFNKDSLENFSKNKNEMLEKLKTLNKEEADEFYEQYLERNNIILENLNIEHDKFLSGGINGIYNKDIAENFTDEEMKIANKFLNKYDLELWYFARGSYIIREVSDFYYKTFKDYVTDDYKEYLKITSNENEEHYVADSGLCIPLEELGDRIVTWENFLEKYPNSKLNDKVNNICNSYRRDYILGVPGGIYDYKESAEEYNRFIKKYPDSPTTELLGYYLEEVNLDKPENNDSEDLSKMIDEYIEKYFYLGSLENRKKGNLFSEQTNTLLKEFNKNKEEVINKVKTLNKEAADKLYDEYLEENKKFCESLMQTEAFFNDRDLFEPSTKAKFQEAKKILNEYGLTIIDIQGEFFPHITSNFYYEIFKDYVSDEYRDYLKLTSKDDDTEVIYMPTGLATFEYNSIIPLTIHEVGNKILAFRNFLDKYPNTKFKGIFSVYVFYILDYIDFSLPYKENENGIDEPEDYYKISQENMVEYKEFVKKNPNELTTKCLNYLLNNYKNKKSEVIGQEIDIIIEKEMKEKFEIEEVWTF